MAINRRRVLQIAGATVVVGAGALTWRAVNRGVFSTGTGAAYEPWTNWRADEPVRALGLVRAAVLAANPHNSQPWMFRVSDDSIDLFADTRRNIGAIDPFLREMYMGVGCTLENLLIAAAGEGYAATVALLPAAAVGYTAFAWINGFDTISIPLIVLFILCMLQPEGRRLYAVMFLASLMAEVYGTWIGNWPS